LLMTPLKGADGQIYAMAQGLDNVVGTHYAERVRQDYLKKGQGDLSGATDPLTFAANQKDTFDTSALQKIVKGLEDYNVPVGQQIIAKNKKDHPQIEATPSDLIPHTGDFKTVASSLARVGGGGRFAVVGMSAQERLMLQQIQNQRAEQQILNAIKSATEKTANQKNGLNRG